MKKIIYSTFLLLIGINLNSQTISWDGLITMITEKTTNYEDLKSIMDKNDTHDFSDKSSLSFEFLVTRNISQLEDYQEDFYTVFATAERGHKYQRNTIRILFKKNKIIKFNYWNISSILENTIVNESLFQAYKTDFESANYISNTTGIFEPDVLFSVSKFGGRSSTPRPKFQELIDLVDSKNKNKILEMAQSTSPEIRTYGAAGLGSLKELSYPLNEEELELLERISNEATVIKSTIGCTKFGYISTVKNMSGSMKNYIKYRSENPEKFTK